MALNSRRALDPRWIVHHRSVPEGFMIHGVTLWRMETARPEWDPETGGITGGELIPLWTGRARIQPNKDWRARYVESGSDPQMVHYIRVQIPLRKNGEPPIIRPYDVFTAADPPDTDDWNFNHDLDAWTLYVRNSTNSSNRWVYNLLCGTDISDLIDNPGS